MAKMHEPGILFKLTVPSSGWTEIFTKRSAVPIRSLGADSNDHASGALGAALRPGAPRPVDEMGDERTGQRQEQKARASR